MSEKREGYLFPAGVGFALGLFSLFAARAVSFGLTIASLAGATTLSPLGIIGAAALTGTGILAFVCGSSALRRSAEWSLAKPLTSFVSGLATLTVGLCLSFGINPFRQKLSSSVPEHNYAPIENTTPLVSHKNTFNTQTKKGRETLVLTAKDFPPSQTKLFQKAC